VRPWKSATIPILLSLAGCLSVPALAKASTLDDAVALQQKGKLKKARELFRSAAADFRSTGDRQNLATALSEAGKISISLGDYADAIKYASEAVELRKTFKDSTGLGADFNALGWANQYLGDYPLALENYENALKEFDRADIVRDVQQSGLEPVGHPSIT
jgi:tetratricopeptide (TPR) repeat protein